SSLKTLNCCINIAGLKPGESRIDGEHRGLHVRLLLVESGCFLKFRARALRVSLLSERGPKRVVDFGRVRRVLDRLAKYGYGLIQLPLLLKDGPERVPGGGVVRFRADRGPEFSSGFVQL